MAEELQTNSDKSVNYDKRALLRRLSNIRAKLISIRPFWGTLLMEVRLGLGYESETACTDMTRIIFNPEFAMRLSDEEITFVLMHEVLHCSLQHCVRGRQLNSYIYNVAADIFVNSHILSVLGLKTFSIDGCEVMNKAPDGKPGMLYSAEEIYLMIMEKYKNDIDDINAFLEQLQEELGVSFDEHEIWKTVPISSANIERWKEVVRTAAKNYSKTGTVPYIFDAFCKKLDYENKLNWRSILQDFIQITYNEYDYTFSPVDKRFSEADFMLPSFYELPEEELGKLWFAVDTSGSVEDDDLGKVYGEIEGALMQFKGLQGMLSFFDTSITDPVPFSTYSELAKIKPKGRGGTNFQCIFNYLGLKMTDDLPVAIIIITDGLAPFPKAEDALGVPVLWIIVGTNAKPSFGVTAYLPE